MATSVTEKVKNLLSSFISDVEKNEDYEKSTKLNDETNTSPTKSVTPCTNASRNKALYYDRVETYSTYAVLANGENPEERAPPFELSPLVCARYGWKNVDTDLLQCVNCHAFLSGQLPTAVDTQLYKESCTKLKKRLIEAHEKLCTWSSNPSSESFSRVPYDNQVELEQDFRQRLATFFNTQTPLPSVTHTSLQQQIIAVDKLQILMEDIQRQTRLPNIDDRPSLDGILFALCGWAYSESRVAVLQCSCCRRRVGLWNYSVTTASRPDNPSSQTDKSTEDELTDTQTEDTQEPAKKRAKIENQSFDPIAEHRYWCPWIQLAVSPLVGETTAPDCEGLQASSSDKKMPAWLLVMRILSHSGDKEVDFSIHMKQSPQLESLKHLRRVLRDCTSKTSPTKNLTDSLRQDKAGD